MTNRLAALVLILMITPAWAQLPSEPFPVAVSDNAPDVIRVENGKLAGVAAPLYQCVFDHSGFEYSFIDMPLARAVYSLEHGKVAVAVPLARSPNRDRFGVFAGPLLEVQYLFLSLGDPVFFDGTEKLHYVLPRQHLGEDFLGGFQVSGFEVNSWDQVFTMLALGRADFTIVPQVILEDITRGFDLSFSTRPAQSVPSSMYVSNVYLGTGLAERLQDSVAACRQRYEAEIREKQAHGSNAGAGKPNP